MSLEKANARTYNYQMYIIQLQKKKKNLHDFMFSEKLSKKDGNKILSEIELIDKEIERKSKAFSDSLRLEFKKIN